MQHERQNDSCSTIRAISVSCCCNSPQRWQNSFLTTYPLLVSRLTRARSRHDYLWPRPRSKLQFRQVENHCFPFPNADFRDIRRYAPINTENTWREQNFNDAELITFSPQSSLPRSKTDFQGILWSTLIHDFTETRERKHDMHGSPAVTNESAKRVSNAGYKNKINQTSESKRGDASRIGNPRHEDESNTPKQWPRMERNLRVKLVESNARIKPRKRL